MIFFMYPGNLVEIISTRSATTLALALALLLPGGLASADETTPSYVDVFQKAMDGRFNMDVTQRVRLTTRSSSGSSTERVVDMALKQIDGKLHAIAEVTEPEYLRGTRVLSIEVAGRDDDQFMYMPAYRRVRRISGAQRADLFFGTDVTLEDFERHYAEDFDLKAEGTTDLRNESVTMIAARPKFDTNYDVALFYIAKDHMIIEIRYFRDEATAPRRIVRGFRAQPPRPAGLTIPARLEIENYRRGTTTTVDFEIVSTTTPVPDSLFSVDFLESSRRIPVPRKGR